MKVIDKCRERFNSDRRALIFLCTMSLIMLLLMSLNYDTHLLFIVNLVIAIGLGAFHLYNIHVAKVRVSEKYISHLKIYGLSNREWLLLNQISNRHWEGNLAMALLSKYEIIEEILYEKNKY